MQIWKAIPEDEIERTCTVTIPIEIGSFGEWLKKRGTE